MGEGIAVLYARGSEDRDGYRQDSDFYYLTGVLGTWCDPVTRSGSARLPASAVLGSTRPGCRTMDWRARASQQAVTR